MVSYGILMPAVGAILTLIASVHATELTVDLHPHKKTCFYEFVEQGTPVTFEFQVVYGGRLDIDAELLGPTGLIWSRRKSQTDEHAFNSPQVYFDVTVGVKEGADALKDDSTMTQIEASISAIHTAFRRIVNFQTHLRMRESYHRHTAEFMNERVQWVSGAEAITLVLVSVFQVIYLRSLFSEKPNKF
eukprot:gene3169-5912_t